MRYRRIVPSVLAVKFCPGDGAKTVKQITEEVVRVASLLNIPLKQFHIGESEGQPRSPKDQDPLRVQVNRPFYGWVILKQGMYLIKHKKGRLSACLPYTFETEYELEMKI